MVPKANTTRLFSFKTLKEITLWFSLSPSREQGLQGVLLRKITQPIGSIIIIPGFH